MGEHLPHLPVHNSTEMLFKQIWGFIHGPVLTFAEMLFIKTAISKTLAWHEKGQDSDVKHMSQCESCQLWSDPETSAREVGGTHQVTAPVG